MADEKLPVTKEEFELNQIDQSDKKYSINLDTKDNDADSWHNYPEDDFKDQFTWRASILGSLLGGIIAASNLYLVLKSGFGFGASLFGALLGFAGLKLISKLPVKLGGGPFGMKENCTAQTAATAAGGLGVGFTSGIPAMYWLDLLPHPEKCWGMFLLWTTAAAFFGLFYAIPLRSYFIIQQKLVFPLCHASAMTIRSLHTGTNEEASTQTKWVVYTFLVSALYKIAAFFAPILTEWRIFYWLSLAIESPALVEINSLWNWKLQLSTAFFGTGILIGMNTAISFMVGNLLAWGVIGPALYHNPNSDITRDPKATSGTNITFWNLWVGVTILVCASFTELAIQYKSFFRGIKGCVIFLYNPIAKFFKLKTFTVEVNSEDPVPAEDQVPTYQWVIGLILSFIMSILVCKYYFNMGAEMGLLAGILGFIFSFIGCQSYGEVNINPLGVISKASQLVFAPIPAETLQLRQSNNLMAGVITSSCAAQAVDMVGDLRAGHLLKATPKSQFQAQLVGSFFGIFISVLLFQLFVGAYPCILQNPSLGKPCEFTVPAARSWMAVTLALTGDIGSSISLSCRFACLGFGLVTILTIILKHTLLKPYASYLLNWNAAGMAFVTPIPSIPLAVFFGSLFAYTANRINSKWWNLIGNSLASGMIAGEGIGGIFHALFMIFGIVQAKVATPFGCTGYKVVGC